MLTRCVNSVFSIVLPLQIVLTECCLWSFFSSLHMINPKKYVPCILCFELLGNIIGTGSLCKNWEKQHCFQKAVSLSFSFFSHLERSVFNFVKNQSPKSNCSWCGGFGFFLCFGLDLFLLLLWLAWFCFTFFWWGKRWDKDQLFLGSLSSFSPVMWSFFLSYFWAVNQRNKLLSYLKKKKVLVSYALRYLCISVYVS